MQQLIDYIKQREVEFENECGSCDLQYKNEYEKVKSFHSLTIKGILEQVEKMCVEMK